MLKVKSINNRGDAKESGMTIIEMMISMAVLAIVSAIAIEVVISLNKSYSLQSVYQDLDIRAINYLNFIKDDLPEANIVSVSNSHSTLEYQLALTYVPPAITWGAYDTSGTQQPNWKYQITFSNAQDLSETADNADYNDNDNIGGEYFKYGKLLMRLIDNLGVTRDETLLADKVIMRTNPTYTLYGYDMKDTGLLADIDPLFMSVDYQGNDDTDPGDRKGIWINIWFALPDPDNPTTNFLLRNIGEYIALRNPQT